MSQDKFSSINEAIREAHQKKFPLFVWQLQNDVLLKAELCIESYTLDRNEIVLQTAKGMEFQLQQMVTGSGQLYFYLPQASLIFSSEIKKLNLDGKLIVAFPLNYHFHDRRELSRFEILGLPLFVHLKVKEKGYKKSCYDISKGGISLLFSQSEKVPYKEGEIISGFKLEFGTHQFFFDAKVVKILKLKPYMIESIPYGGSKLSLKFEKIEEKNIILLEKLTNQLEELLKKKSFSS